MGTVFLVGQGYEYYHLVEHGLTIQSSVYGSVFYITTGFHAAHVLAGVLAFVVVLLRVAKGKFTPAQATAAWWCHTTGTLLTLSGSACLPPSTSFNKPFWSDSPKIKGK